MVTYGDIYPDIYMLNDILIINDDYVIDHSYIRIIPIILSRFMLIYPYYTYMYNNIE